MQIADYFIKPFTHIINLSFLNNVFPKKKKKISNICPIHKFGNATYLIIVKLLTNFIDTRDNSSTPITQTYYKMIKIL